MRKNKRKKLDLTTFEGRIEKQGYHKVGMHSAAKICKYAKDSILGKTSCYKNKFYGISSHRCLQCSPVLQFCNLSCKFCWRLIPETKSGWVELPQSDQTSLRGGGSGRPSNWGGGCPSSAVRFEWDEPLFIAEGLIYEQKRIMSGFLGNKKANKQLAKEAMEPNQVALSLIGEPTIYPKMSELIKEFHKRNMTTFLVSNGTFPNAIQALTTLPTQLYISLISPDEKTYANVTQQTPAQTKLNWKNFLSSLELMKKLSEKTRTVLRMTLVRNLNNENLDGYANLIKKAMPHYVEVKSFVFVGGARNECRGLKLSDMLSMDEIRKISAELAKKTGYLYVDEHKPSRVVLLARNKKAKENRMITCDRKG
ncbi:MAG: 4-demethylwyosine synthase TYW1 [Candidatus Micrarchaeota archaeon]